MHEMQTIVTSDRSVCLSVCLSVTQLNLAAHAMHVGSFEAAFAKLLWPFVHFAAVSTIVDQFP